MLSRAITTLCALLLHIILAELSSKFCEARSLSYSVAISLSALTLLCLYNQQELNLTKLLLYSKQHTLAHSCTDAV